MRRTLVCPIINCWIIIITRITEHEFLIFISVRILKQLSIYCFCITHFISGHPIQASMIQHPGILTMTVQASESNGFSLLIKIKIFQRTYRNQRSITICQIDNFVCCDREHRKCKIFIYKKGVKIHLSWKNQWIITKGLRLQNLCVGNQNRTNILWRILRRIGSI